MLVGMNDGIKACTAMTVYSHSTIIAFRQIAITILEYVIMNFSSRKADPGVKMSLPQFFPSGLWLAKR